MKPPFRSEDMSWAVLDAVERFSRVIWNGTVGRWEPDRFLVHVAFSAHPGSPVADRINECLASRTGTQILAYVQVHRGRGR